MTENEILLLAIGFSLGAHSMNLLHFSWQRRDERRSAKAARAARHRSAGDCYLNSLSLYQLQARYAAAPHPTETLEASVRDFELDLRDGLDRVERAARDEGLL
ncbi:hypothetical protein [Streptomyces sp. NRRL S-813]|uniref:hypothetical protein n=1 Tax=Streptomyces sp. NRRL S-813 TaxID=1463919 RepID=UPI0004BF6246|nr:hypothetical protein [Streptomyces sp. NRRL S-813]